MGYCSHNDTLVALTDTGKYYYLNLTCAILPAIGAAAMVLMDQKPRWTDWLNVFPHGIGSGGNGMCREAPVASSRC